MAAPANMHRARLALSNPPALLRTMLAPDVVLSRLLAFLPSVFKYTALLLVLLNVRSFPLSWHLRVFAPLLKLHIQYRWLLLKLALTFRSKKDKVELTQQWLDKLSPIGQSPFAILISHPAWAGPDDCDYNLHLSNSCYPKILDRVRLRGALAIAPAFCRHGGWIALGATHHSFIREIPMFAKYEVRMSVGSWDEKWVYIFIRFVSKPKQGKRSKTVEALTPAPGTLSTIQTPVAPADTAAPPSDTDTSGSGPGGAASGLGRCTPPGARDDAGANSVAALARAASAAPEPDGAVLHCVAVSVMCFKHGRITVPPALVLAAEGLSRAPGKEDGAGATYSPERPPPHWTAHAQRLRSQACSREYTTLLRGGWRDVPAGARWWEDALGGEVEAQRAARLASLRMFREGMEGARELPLNP